MESENGIRLFQEEMKEFSGNDNDVLLLDAPTGAGKTRGFLTMNENGGVIIVLPTNILSNQVYEDLLRDKKSVVMLSKEMIDKALESDYSNRSIGRLNALKDIIYFKNFIVTNPTVLLYLILNYYGHREDEEIGGYENDMAIFLLKQGFKTIIFDEFHVYSPDQVRIVLSINTILRNNFKFVYSSATPTKMVRKALNGMAGLLNLKIQEIEVPRLTNGEGVPVQGPLDVTICAGAGYAVSDFVKENTSLFMKDYWLLIVDRITEIENVYKELIEGGVKDEDMALLDGYHRRGGFGKRVVIASNLVEQGINPDKEYRKIVMDSGHGIKNLMQRLGRIGRGTYEESSVYICIPKVIAGGFHGSIGTYDQLIDYLSPILPERERSVSLYSIGVFIGAIVTRFSGKLRIILESSLDGTGSIYSGFLDFNQVDRKLSEKTDWVKNNVGEFPDLRRITKWWMPYRKTLYNFIEENVNEEITDISLGPDQRFEAKYNLYWILSNKVLSKTVKGDLIAESTREVPDLNFEVSVSGIPFSEKANYRYSEILYNSKAVITDALEVETSNGSLAGRKSEIDETLQKIERIVKRTAGKGRLVIVGYRPMHV
ncbi:MAG: type I-D CRISPR-associated helicase Cas3' [Thermoplasmatales archaeon]|nr:type I-D CRISPR-associated helicase Cas3' [Thermoplasmatales archaeon]